MVTRLYLCDVCRSIYYDEEHARDCESRAVYEGKEGSYHGFVFLDRSRFPKPTVIEFLFIYAEDKEMASVNSDHERLYSDIMVPGYHIQDYISGTEKLLDNPVSLSQRFSKRASDIDRKIEQEMYLPVEKDLVHKINSAYRSRKRKVSSVKAWKTL